MNGRRQREVVSALERALRGGATGDLGALEQGAVTIRRLNQLPAYSEVPALLATIALTLKTGADVRTAYQAIGRLREVVGDSPVAPLVDGLLRAVN